MPVTQSAQQISDWMNQPLQGSGGGLNGQMPLTSGMLFGMLPNSERTALLQSAAPQLSPDQIAYGQRIYGDYTKLTNNGFTDAANNLLPYLQQTYGEGRVGDGALGQLEQQMNDPAQEAALARNVSGSLLAQRQAYNTGGQAGLNAVNQQIARSIPQGGAMQYTGAPMGFSGYGMPQAPSQLSYGMGMGGAQPMPQRAMASSYSPYPQPQMPTWGQGAYAPRPPVSFSNPYLSPPQGIPQAQGGYGNPYMSPQMGSPYGSPYGQSPYGQSPYGQSPYGQSGPPMFPQNSPMSFLQGIMNGNGGPSQVNVGMGNSPYALGGGPQMPGPYSSNLPPGYAPPPGLDQRANSLYGMLGNMPGTDMGALQQFMQEQANRASSTYMGYGGYQIPGTQGGAGLYQNPYPNGYGGAPQGQGGYPGVGQPLPNAYQPRTPTAPLQTYAGGRGGLFGQGNMALLAPGNSTFSGQVSTGGGSTNIQRNPYANTGSGSVGSATLMPTPDGGGGQPDGGGMFGNSYYGGY